MKAYCRPTYDKGTLWYETECWPLEYTRFASYKSISRILVKRDGKKRARQISKKILLDEQTH